MKPARTLVLLALAALAAALAAAPLPAAAVEPERLSRALEVKVRPGPAVEVQFALALSEISTYPVTITAIGGTVEEQLWTGSLPDGVFRLTVPLTKIKPGPFRVVVRTKVTNRDGKKSSSFLTYQRWEGVLP